jgi:hypothetical protein
LLGEKRVVTPSMNAPMRIRRRLRQLGPHACRWASVGVTLSAYLLAVIGFPLPVRPARVDSQPYPCQTRPCGCQSAEQCRHCCCCSRANDPAGGEAAKSCCAKDPSQSQPPGDTGTRWVIGALSQQCGGLVTLWIAIGAVLPSPPIASALAGEPPSEALAPLTAVGPSQTTPPPVPPPRSICL